MLLLLFPRKSNKIYFFREKKLVFFKEGGVSTTFDEKFGSSAEKATLYQIGGYSSRIRNILDVEKLKNLNKPVNFRKGNTNYSIIPDPENKDAVNIIIQELNPKNPAEVKRLSVFTFVNGRLHIKRDVHGNITSKELLKFFRDFNIQLKEIDLIVKKEYEFFLIRQRLPGIFCSDWVKPFREKLHVKRDTLEIKKSKEGVELEYTARGKTIKWKLDKNFLLISGDLKKLLFVLNHFSRELIGIDKQIGFKIQAEKDEYRRIINDMGILFTPGAEKGRVRNFTKEYKKSDSKKLFIFGDGEKINFIYRRSGLDKKWVFNNDKKLTSRSAGLRDLLLVFRDFRTETEDLKNYLKNKEEEKKKMDQEILSFIGKYPGVFMKRQGSVEIKDRDGGILKISAAEAFNVDNGKFFLTYQKAGASKHFYFAEKSLQSQTEDSGPFGAERQNTLPGQSKKIYYFNADPVQLLLILKTFEPQILNKTKAI